MSKRKLKKEVASLERSVGYWIGRYNEAADKLTAERIISNGRLNDAQKMADVLMSDWVIVRESKINAVDEVLGRYLGERDDGTD